MSRHDKDTVAGNSLAEFPAPPRDPWWRASLPAIDRDGPIQAGRDACHYLTPSGCYLPTCPEAFCSPL